MKKIFKIFSSAGRSRPVQGKTNDSPHAAMVRDVNSEKGDEVISYIPSMASIERLPIEIQSAILLKIGDIASLKSLVWASRRYHSTYAGQRHAIFKQVLFNSIPPDVLYDAFSAIHSIETLSSNTEDRTARVKAFLSEYKANRDEWTPPEQLDLESLFRLARLQNHVQHATKDLCQAAFKSHPFTGTQVGPGDQLSSNEMRRFYRTFYRFEMFCNLFGHWESPLAEGNRLDCTDGDGDSTFELDSMEKSSRFLSLFNPWEVEELACVRDYFYSYYRRMLHQFAPDILERNPRLDLSEDGPWLEDNIEFLMALSLQFYRRMETSSPGRQMRYLYHGLHIGPSFLSAALKEPPLAAVHQTLAVDDVAEAHFEGDSVRAGPNVMWLWAADNKVDFDYFLWQNEPLREWGYVFWDQNRLEKWGLPNEPYETWVERWRAALRRKIAERS